MSARRDLALLAGRGILGGYLAAHGAQKLFGSFGGPGINATASAFDRIGLRPGRLMATTAGLSEFGGGLLTLLGFAHPLGPVSLVGTMAVASTTHRANGPFAGKQGYELALTNLGSALILGTLGPGRYSADHILGCRFPSWVARLTVFGAAAASAGAITMLLRTELEPPLGSGPDREAEVSDTASARE
jgi:putative oxidoreductase